MKKLLIFISIIATNSLFASNITSETVNKQETIDVLIKNDILIERELSPSRIAPMSRELGEHRVVRMGRGNRAARIARDSREVRENRVVRMGRNSRGIRPERIVHIVHSVQHPTIKTLAIIKTNYLSNLIK